MNGTRSAEELAEVMGVSEDVIIAGDRAADFLDSLS